ncbi:MAG: glutathione peroxidase [Rhodocyclaceae bacterium]|nr:glutathione peroxidase [Rhodocyclaceae bacterium]
MPGIHDFSATTLDGHEQSLADYKGKVVLIVNTASKCGFTPQYEGLEQLHREYSPRGLVILGFPCNQFGAQEPGDAVEIASFCSLTYQVSFPMFAKVDVNGDHAHPLFRFLKAAKPGLLGTEGIKWNFTKFLVGKDGEVVGRYAPATKPEELTKEIEALI